MVTLKADLHVHTVLSPCGDLDMSPRAIISRCAAAGVDMVGITDHNTTLQVPVMIEAGREKGVFVLPGVELTTSEEVHVLAYFPHGEAAGSFQKWIDINLPVVKNREDLFGHQVVVDISENIVMEEPRLLITALTANMNETVSAIREHGGIVVPAHIGKGKNSLFSQLGFIPHDLYFDALEAAGEADHKRVVSMHPELAALPFIYGSDSHYLSDIGRHSTLLKMKSTDFTEIKKAISNAGLGG